MQRVLPSDFFKTGGEGVMRMEYLTFIVIILIVATGYIVSIKK